jgi:hypothetical protein
MMQPRQHRTDSIAKWMHKQTKLVHKPAHEFAKRPTMLLLEEQFGMVDLSPGVLG